MNLRELWNKYDTYSQFNVSVQPEEIRAQGVQLVYPALLSSVWEIFLTMYILYSPVLP